MNGINGSGKTTFLRMIQHNLILAHIGCFVPCERMAFSPINRLYCRAGTLDSIENGTSSFLQELKDISMITNQLANLKYNRAKSAEELLKVMVFFDELGINTSIEQGLPLMWSICEYLMSLEKVGVVVATHNHFLN